MQIWCCAYVYINSNNVSILKFTGVILCKLIKHCCVVIYNILQLDRQIDDNIKLHYWSTYINFCCLFLIIKLIVINVSACSAHFLWTVAPYYTFAVASDMVPLLFYVSSCSYLCMKSIRSTCSHHILCLYICVPLVPASVVC